MAGEWVWTNDSRLTFRPKQDWAVDQEYKVEFQHSLFPDHVRLSEYKYRLKYRPCDTGCQPNCFIKHQEMDKRETGFWGELTYDRELTEKEIYKYELFVVSEND